MAIQILDGIAAAIFGVVVIHSSFGGRFDQKTMAVQAGLARFFDWAVLAFFFSSGFLHDRNAPFITTLRKRAAALLIPFFLYNAFYIVCFLLLEAAGWLPAGTLKVHLNSFDAAMSCSPAFQLYFLPYLFVISTGVGGLEKLMHRHCRWSYLAMFSLIVMFYLEHGYPQMSHGSNSSNLPMYLAAFLIGIASRPFLEKPLAGLQTFWTAIFLLASILALFRFCEASLLVPPFLTAMAGGIQFIRNSGLLQFVGRMAGSIYLWHTPLILPVLARILSGCGVPSLVNFFGSIVLTLTICILLRVGLDAIFLKMMKRTTPRFLTL